MWDKCTNWRITSIKFTFLSRVLISTEFSHVRIALLCRGSNVTARVNVVNRASHALPAGKVTDAAKDVTGDFHNWTPVEVIISVKRSIPPTTSRKNPF